MKALITGAAMLLMAAPAVAQTSTSNQPSSSPQTTQQNATSNQNLAAAQKIKQDLQGAGFSDVKVVAESFVVQAKTKDGNPVVMTIGPHGMSVFEAMNSSNSGNTTGSSTSGSGTGGSSSSSNSGLASQK
jgi:hypothetical protein